MGINIAFALQPFFYLAANDLPNNSNINNLPILGMYIINSKGDVRLFCDEANTDQRKSILYIASNGITGHVDSIEQEPLNASKPNISEKDAPNGFMTSIINNNTIYSYKGKINSIKSMNTNGLSDGADIGVLLREGSTIEQKLNSSQISITFNSQKYYITRYNSNEGIHVECFDEKTNKNLSHYYYYLGYDVESDIHK